MNILVTGANGQLGNEIRELTSEYSGWKFFFSDLPGLDIANAPGVEQYIDKDDIDIIINCAAYTSVDKAESDIELAFKVNATGPEVLAKVASKKKCQLYHISTDFVFDGKKSTPYVEEDKCNSPSVYGKTKQDGEVAVLENCKTAAIVRTSWLYSSFGNNFVKTMLRLGKEKEQLGVVYDQVGTPTYAADLATAVLKLIDYNLNNKPEFGIFHYSNEGVASWYDFTKAIHEIAGVACNVQPILAEQYPLPAPRPAFSVLDKNKIKKVLNITIPYWKDSLLKCIEKINNDNK